MRPMLRFLVVLALASPFAAAISAGCGSDPKGGSAAGTSSSTSSSGGGASASSSGTSGTAGAGGTNTGGMGGAGGLGTGGTGTGGVAAGGMGGGGPIVFVEAPCQAQTYQCGDTLDNDGDGLIDWQDPDCLGPCHNAENTFYGSIPGQAGPKCTVDCYFDDDSGSGNDECCWTHECDPNSVAPYYYPEPENGASCEYNQNANPSCSNQGCSGLYQSQPQVCHDICGPLTPNGCDCFGCCELPGGSGNFAFLGSVDAVTGLPSCSLGSELDPAKCHPCQPVAACLNECKPCEVCLGKVPNPIDNPECFPPPPPDGGIDMDGGGSSSSSSSSSSGGEQCPPGVQPCGLAGQAPCPYTHYCITGCCQAIPN